jgi:hypothetical protein
MATSARIRGEPASVTKHDGTLNVLCFSYDCPEAGPTTIHQQQTRVAFNSGNGSQNCRQMP